MEKETPYYISVLFRNWNPEEIQIKWTVAGAEYVLSIAPGREEQYHDIFMSSKQPADIEFSVSRTSDQKPVYINGKQLAKVTPSLKAEEITLVVNSGITWYSYTDVDSRRMFPFSREIALGDVYKTDVSFSFTTGGNVLGAILY